MNKFIKKLLTLGLAITMIVTVLPFINLDCISYGNTKVEERNELDRSDLLTKYKSNPFKGTAEKIANKQNVGYGTSLGVLHQELSVMYYKGKIYTDTFKFTQKNGKKATPFIKNVGDYMTSNFQVYNNKIYFEGELSSGMTTQHLFRANLDGTGLTKLIKNTLSPNNAQSFTIYKGKLYGITYGSGTNNTGKYTIRSYDLNGKNKKTIITDNIAGAQGGRKYSFRGYAIYKNRIYYIKSDGKLVSVDMSGKNKKTIVDVSSHATPNDNDVYAGIGPDRTLSIVSVYNGYVYYRNRDGLNRISTSGKNNKCILEKFIMPNNISIYGNKISYKVEDQYYGLMNVDGTNKKLFPSSYFTVPLGQISTTLGILNANISYLDGKVLYNSPSNKGYVLLNKPGNFGWHVQKNPPTIYNQGHVNIYAKGDLKEGTYYINGLADGRYTLGISGASKNDGVKVILWDRSESDNRKFKVKKVGTNKYTLTAVHSNKLLTSAGKKGKPIYQSPKNDSGNQVFTIKYNGTGYNIVDCSGYNLDIAGASYKNGTEVLLWDEKGTNNQTYTFQYVKKN